MFILWTNIKTRESWVRNFELSYILDDSVKVAKIAIQSGFMPILFGHHNEFINENE